MRSTFWLWAVAVLGACGRLGTDADEPPSLDFGSAMAGGGRVATPDVETASGQGGAAGQAGASACEKNSECPAGQRCTDGECGCPDAAPDYCEADAQCVALDNDANHCGACDNACDGRRGCDFGQCGPEPVSIAVLPFFCGGLYLQRVGTTLYLLANTQGTLWRLDLSVSSMPILIAGGMGSASSFRIDGDNAYVASNNSVVRVALASGTKATIATMANLEMVRDLAVSQGSVYFAAGKQVLRVDASADYSVPEVVSEANEAVYARGIDVAGDYVLWVSASTVESESLPDGIHQVLATAQVATQGGPRSVQHEGTNVYWMNDGIVRTKFSPLAVPVLETVATAPAPATAFALAFPQLYVASSGELYGATIGQGRIRGLAHALDFITAIETDDAHIYVATALCQVFRVDR